ncbi:CMTM4 family protein [Megaselia abdita]
MAQQGFPGSHTTTTSVTQTTVSPQIRYDPTYIKTIPGILKCACLVLNLVGFICIQCSGALSYHTRGSFFSTISMTGFWFTGIMLILYLIHICEKFYKIPWLKIEMYFDVSWTILYLIASSFAAALGNEAYAAAAVSINLSYSLNQLFIIFEVLWILLHGMLRVRCIFKMEISAIRGNSSRIESNQQRIKYCGLTLIYRKKM